MADLTKQDFIEQSINQSTELYGYALEPTTPLAVSVIAAKLAVNQLIDLKHQAWQTDPLVDLNKVDRSIVGARLLAGVGQHLLDMMHQY